MNLGRRPRSLARRVSWLFAVALAALVTGPANAGAVTGYKDIAEGVPSSQIFETYIGADAAANVHIFDTIGITRLSPTGEPMGYTSVESIPSPASSSFRGFDVAPDGTSYIAQMADTPVLTGLVYRLPFGGTPTEIFRLPNAVFTDLVVDENGVYIGETKTCPGGCEPEEREYHIRRLSSSGATLGRFAFDNFETDDASSLGRSEANSDIFATNEFIGPVKRYSPLGATVGEYGDDMTAFIGGSAETSGGSVFIAWHPGVRQYASSGGFVDDIGLAAQDVTAVGNRAFVLRQTNSQGGVVSELADVPPLNMEMNATWKQRGSKVLINANCNRSCSFSAYGELKVGKKKLGDLPVLRAEDYSEKRQEFQIRLSKKLQKRVRAGWKKRAKVRAYVYGSGTGEFITADNATTLDLGCQIVALTPKKTKGKKKGRKRTTSLYAARTSAKCEHPDAAELFAQSEGK